MGLLESMQDLVYADTKYFVGSPPGTPQALETGLSVNEVNKVMTSRFSTDYLVVQ